MAIDITLIRHGETEGNITDVWQGHGDSPLTAHGRAQADALGRRLTDRVFDRVVSSDLGRVLETAHRAGLEPEPLKEWREVHLGAWEGLTRDQVLERFPDEMAALAAGEEVRLGGGESWPEFGARIDKAFDALVDSLDEGARVAIVAHGGVVHSVVSAILGFRGHRRAWPVASALNTGITRITVDGDERSITVFNDATHTVASRASWEAAGTVVGLVRHGESEGNVSGRWQGRTDGKLTDRGRAQAEALAAWYDGVTHLYTSPLSRARDTAEALARTHGLVPVVHDDVVEMSFGRWEGMTSDEIVAVDGDAFALAFERDYPRGDTGETFSGVGERLGLALGAIAASHPGDTVGVVSHGGAIRAFSASLVGLDHPTRNRLAIPDNASVSHVRFGPDGPVLVDYNTPGG